MDKEHSKEILKQIWRNYKIFCKEASITFNMKGDSAPDFLGWLEKHINKDEDNN